MIYIQICCQEREKDEKTKVPNIKDSATSPTRPVHVVHKEVKVTEPENPVSSNLTSTAIFANSTVRTTCVRVCIMKCHELLVLLLIEMCGISGKYA